MCELAGTSRSTRDAFHHLDPALREKAAEDQLVEPFRHRRGRAVRQHRLRAERDGHVEPMAEPLGDPVVLRAALVPLPVHAGGAAVEHLHAIGADVPHAGLGIFGEHQRQRDESSAVFGPALEDRQLVERAVSTNDFLARRILDRLRHQIAQPAHHRQHLERVHDAFGHLRRHELVDFRGEIVERLDAERQAHAFERSEHVAGDRHVEPGGLLEQQRRTAARHLARAVGDGGDLEIRADRLVDARQQLALVEIGEEIVEVCVHRRVITMPRNHEDD